MASTSAVSRQEKAVGDSFDFQTVTFPIPVVKDHLESVVTGEAEPAAALTAMSSDVEALLPQD